MALKARPSSECLPMSSDPPVTYEQAQDLLQQITEHRKELARLQLNMRLQMTALDKQYQELSLPHLEAINVLSQRIGIWRQRTETEECFS